MPRALKPIRTVAPTETPLTLAEAKENSEIEHDERDDWITALIQAATSHLDGYTGILGRALVTQTWQQSFSAFPTNDIIRLPLAPVSSISSVSYYDTDSAEQTLAPSSFSLHEDALSPFIRLDQDASWPSTEARGNAATITFVAGYGAASDVPEPIKQAIRFLVSHWIENREAVITGTIVTETPLAVQYMLAPYRRAIV